MTLHVVGVCSPGHCKLYAVSVSNIKWQYNIVIIVCRISNECRHVWDLSSHSERRSII